MADHYDLEEKTGVRFTYDILPNNQNILINSKIPLSSIITPFKKLPLNILNYKMLKCKCGAVINPYCQINTKTQLWTCNFCLLRNNFPKNYEEYLKENIYPEEVKADNTVIEYILDENNDIFICLALDKCIDYNEFEYLKNGILELIPQLPTNANIILMTYDRFIQFYLNKNTIIPIINQFSPYITNMDFLLQLKYYKTTEYIFKLSNQDHLNNLINIIKQLEASTFEVKQNERFKTSTGKAFEYIIDFKNAVKLKTLRSIFFVGGPCTISDGRFANLDITDHARNKYDLERNNEKAQLANNSKIFFESITKKAIEAKITFDIFGYSLTEFGLLEMSSIVEKTGGIIFYNEEFKKDIFKSSLLSFYSKDSDTNLFKFGFNGHITLNCSNNIKINGCLGCISPLNYYKKDIIANEKMFVSGTDSFFIGGADYNTSLFVFYSIEDNKGKFVDLKSPSMIYFQYNFDYIHPDGTSRVRVITIEKVSESKKDLKEYLPYLDQITICALFIKVAAEKSKTLDGDSLLRWIDRSLLTILKKFSNNGNIPNELSLLPQMFYYLRKNNICKTISISIDEVTFNRIMLLREESNNMLLIIQPQVFEYSVDNEDFGPNQVLCDLKSLKNNVILLVDNYFNVIIWRGQDLLNWKKDGYFELEEYAYLNDLEQKPYIELENIKSERLISPEIYNSYPGAPNERYLKSKLNPDNGYSEELTDENCITNEKTLLEFIEKITEIIGSNKI